MLFIKIVFILEIKKRMKCWKEKFYVLLFLYIYLARFLIEQANIFLVQKCYIFALYKKNFMKNEMSIFKVKI